MSAGLEFCRFLHVAAAMLMFGTSGFVWALVPAASAQALVGRLERRACALAVVVAFTALAWLILQAGEIAGDPLGMPDLQTVSDVLFGTAFGRAWQVHLVLCAGLAAVSFLARANRLGWSTLFSALVLGSLGLVGHAAIQPGVAGWLERGNHALHLLAAGAWIGSLAPLLPVMRALQWPERRSEATLVLVRFSAAGHWAVAVVVLTGILDTVLILGRWPLYPSSPYVGLLLGKLTLVLGMIGIAVLNRYRLVPRMSGSPARMRAWLARNTVAELVLGGLVLSVSVVLGSLDPG